MNAWVLGHEGAPREKDGFWLVQLELILDPVGGFFGGLFGLFLMIIKVKLP